MWTLSKLKASKTSFTLLGLMVQTWSMEFVWLGRSKYLGVSLVPPSSGWYSQKVKYTRRSRRRWFSVRVTSTARVSFRWYCGCCAEKNQFRLPLIGVVRFGTGYAFRIPRPLGVAVNPVVVVPGAGMMLPGNGWPVFGSTSCTALP